MTGSVSRRLGERLVAAGILTEAQIAVALEAQVLAGGRLGTHLVQIHNLELDVLARTLGDLMGVPPALERDFAGIDGRVIARLSAEIAGRCRAVPVALVAAGKRLVVAFVDPRARALAAIVEKAAGIEIEARVAPELRIAYRLEKHYGIARTNRMLRAPGSGAASPPPVKSSAGDASAERRRIAAANPPVAMPPSGTAPTPPAGTAVDAQRLARIEVQRRVSAPVREQPTEPDPFDLPIVFDNRRESALLRQSVAAIDAAPSGSALGDALVAHLKASVACGVVAVVRKGTAFGWRGHVSVPERVLPTIAVPLSLPTAFGVAYDAAATYRGPVPSHAAASAWHKDFCKLIGASAPQELAVVPILGGGGVTGLIYAQMPDGARVPEGVVTELETVAEAVGEALQRLARR